MQSVLVKIVPPAQTPAPCDQRTARVRTTVDLCLDLLAKVLRSATVRSAILREENRVSLGLPAQKSAPCELRGARCDRRNGTACATVCELRAVLCELQSCLSTCLASMLRAAICELRLATGPRIASCLARASQLAGCDPAARCQMVCCVPSLTNKYTPGCSHLLGRELSQVAPRRNGGLVACDGVSCSRVPARAHAQRAQHRGWLAVAEGRQVPGARQGRLQDWGSSMATHYLLHLSRR